MLVSTPESKTIYRNVFWFARCGCGWDTTAPNELDVLVGKVRTHLAAIHQESPVDVIITAVEQERVAGTLPAVPPPDGAEALDAAQAAAAEQIEDVP